MPLTSDRRDELLDKIVDALLDSGVADFSLRPLAHNVGSSARLLIYHFESKEKLLTLALARIRARIEASLTRQAQNVRPTNAREALQMFWLWALEDANQRYFRVLFEVDGLSMREHNGLSDKARPDGSSFWFDVISRTSPPGSGAENRFTSRSTLILAAVSGLLQDVLTSGERSRATEALNFLIELLERESMTPPPAVLAQPGAA